MKIYRVSIIGLGRMGSTIDDEVVGSRAVPVPYSIAAAATAGTRFELAAGCDLIADRREAFRERWGVTALYSDYHDMIEKETPDLVAICTRADTHSQIAVDVARAGVPMLYLEKSIACSPRENDAVLEACRVHGTIFNSGVLNRFNNRYMVVRELIRSGRIGVPQAAVHFGGRSLLHGHIHTIDTLSYLLGDPPIEAVRGELIPRDLEIVENRLEADPKALFELRFDGGLKAWTVPAGKIDYEVLGTQGSIRSLNNSVAMQLRTEGPPDGRHIIWQDTELPAVEPESSVMTCLEDLINANECGRPTRGPIELAHHITEACFAVAESHRRDGAWVDLPLDERDLYIFHV